MMILSALLCMQAQRQYCLGIAVVPLMHRPTIPTLFPYTTLFRSLLCKAALVNCFISLGKALPATDINPCAPMDAIGRNIASSPDTNRKSAGLSLIILLYWSKSPHASLIPTMLLKCLAKRNVVSGSILLPVRRGTL